MSKLIVTSSNGKPVNMRQQPSTSAKILQQIPVSTEIELIEKSSDTWYKIKYLGTYGYMMAKYLKEKQQTISQEDLRKVYNSLNETLALIEKILK